MDAETGKQQSNKQPQSEGSRRNAATGVYLVVVYDNKDRQTDRQRRWGWRRRRQLRLRVTSLLEKQTNPREERNKRKKSQLRMKFVFLIRVTKKKGMWVAVHACVSLAAAAAPPERWRLTPTAWGLLLLVWLLPIAKRSNAQCTVAHSSFMVGKCNYMIWFFRLGKLLQ